MRKKHKQQKDRLLKQLPALEQFKQLEMRKLILKDLGI